MRKLLLVLFVIFSGSAEARHHVRHVVSSHVIVCDMRGCNDLIEQHQQVSRHRYVSNDGEIVSHPSGCPRSAFCGCGASVRIFGHPVRDLYLAANWFRFPHAIAAPGMVAVRSHHVFVIESVNGDGTVVAFDANSGHHQTRIHTVSLAGYSVRDPSSSSTITTATRHRISRAPNPKPSSHGRSVDENDATNSLSGIGYPG